MSKFANLMNVIPGRVRIIGFLAAVLLGVLACTPADAQFLQGILQDVDSANGEITIVTKDGKTITLTISTDAPVDTDGAASSFEALEPGVSIEVNVADDGEHATEISARQTKAKGSVVSVEGNQVSIQTGDGSIVVVTVDETTRIELEEDLPADPETGVAFKLDFDREEVEIEGLVVNVDDDQVTLVKGGEKVYHCGGGIVYHRRDEKGLNWEPGGIRSGAGVRSSGVSQESTGSSDTWEAALCRLCLRR